MLSERLSFARWRWLIQDTDGSRSQSTWWVVIITIGDFQPDELRALAG